MQFECVREFKRRHFDHDYNLNLRRMLNTTPAKVDNVSAVAHTELSERAGNGSTDVPQLPQVQVPHGTTTAFRPVTKSFTA